jgi:hypothetical protein
MMPSDLAGLFAPRLQRRTAGAIGAPAISVRSYAHLLGEVVLRDGETVQHGVKKVKGEN